MNEEQEQKLVLDRCNRYAARCALTVLQPDPVIPSTLNQLSEMVYEKFVESDAWSEVEGSCLSVRIAADKGAFAES